MKKNVMILSTSIMMMLTSLVGCELSNKPKLNRIGEYLYEITFKDDLDWSKATSIDISEYACSGIQNGQYRGRNYDFTYTDCDLCVVHVEKNKSRPHSSIGLSDFTLISDIYETYDLDIIPFSVLDGINDAGVCIQANMLPIEEEVELKHTDTKEDDLGNIAVIRYVLDYADSVNDAIRLLKDKDIYPHIASEDDVHWMISGPTSKTDSTIKTVVLEVYSDGLHVIENFIDNKPIMTNFSITNFDGSIDSIGYGSGYERWEILNKYYSQANSIMGTFDLMEKVHCSKMYDLYSDKFWYSEYNGVNLSNIYTPEELKTLLGEETYNEYIKTLGAVYYNPSLFDGEDYLGGDTSKAGIISKVLDICDEYYQRHSVEDYFIWITVYTTVYDIENKTLDIQVHEGEDVLHFSI